MFNPLLYHIPDQQGCVRVHFLAFLPEKVSLDREKGLVNSLIKKKMETNDVTTGYMTEVTVITLLMP